MMNKVKKGLLIVLAMALMCTITAMITLAYLTKETDTLTNTFSASSDLVDTTFTLQENKVTKSGIDYVLGTDEITVGTIAYDGITPGAKMAKNPSVTLDLKTGVSAYLYVVVTDTLGTGYTWSMDTTNWTELIGADLPTGVAAGSKVYAYKGGTVQTGAAGVDLTKINIIQNQQVTAASDAELENLGGSLIFKAYTCQALGYNFGSESTDIGKAKIAFNTAF